eukprot:10255339-Alexandrium_andersonii.AAC.1
MCTPWSGGGLRRPHRRRRGVLLQRGHAHVPVAPRRPVRRPHPGAAAVPPAGHRAGRPPGAGRRAAAP